MSRQKEASVIESIQQLIKLGVGAAALLKYSDLFLKYRDDLDKIPLDQRSFPLCLDLLTMILEPKNWPAMDKFLTETDEDDLGAAKDKPMIDAKDLIDARIKIHEVGNPVEINTHEVRGLSWPISAQIEAKIRQNLAQEIASLDKVGYTLFLENPRDLIIRSCFWSSTPPTIVQGLDRIENAFEIMEALGEKIRKLFPEFSDQAFHYYLD